MRKFSGEIFTVFDLETTGGRPEISGILEIGLVKIKEYEIVDRFSSLVNPLFPIPRIVEQMTGISQGMVESAPTFVNIAEKIADFIDCDVLVVHNGPFDLQFLNYHLEQTLEITLKNPLLCTVKLGERLLPQAPNRRLKTLAQHLDIPFAHQHRAFGDAEVTAKLFLIYLNLLEEMGIHSLGDLVYWMQKGLKSPAGNKSR